MKTLTAIQISEQVHRQSSVMDVPDNLHTIRTWKQVNKNIARCRALRGEMTMHIDNPGVQVEIEKLDAVLIGYCLLKTDMLDEMMTYLN